jgi:hypothetical protein
MRVKDIQDIMIISRVFDRGPIQITFFWEQPVGFQLFGIRSVAVHQVKARSEYGVEWYTADERLDPEIEAHLRERFNRWSLWTEDRVAR